MRLAIASGKGGTGKTTVAASLASMLAEAGEHVAYFDCDVEEPNGHVLLAPDIEHTVPVEVPVPLIDSDKCTGCGECAEICRYNALACLAGSVVVFEELCRGCGGCSLVCPAGAVGETERRVGSIAEGRAGALRFLQGRMSIGEARAIPVIRALKQRLPEDGLVILDAPPGTSCPVVETVRGADWVILVTEPTPFGLSDLELAVGMTRELGLPTGVVINRCGIGDSRVQEYCREEGLPVYLEIPNDRAVAEAYARGILPGRAVPGYEEMMRRLLGTVLHLTAEARSV